MKLFLSPSSCDVILLLISDAIDQKLKQSADNIFACGSCIQATRTMHSESFWTFRLSVIPFYHCGGSTNKEQEN